MRATWMTPQLISILFFGFASGLPLSLTGSTLQAWMASQKVDLTLIGIFSLVGLPYTLKFLWAPIMDRFIPPFLGRRRGWIACTQMALILGIGLLGLCNPSSDPFLLAMLAVMIAFFSASQDIVIDAYRTEVLTPTTFGVGAALANFGYRIAMILSGAVALILSDHYEWSTVYFMMAGLMGIGLITSFLSPESDQSIKVPRTIQEAVVEPFKDFFRRKGVWELFAFIFLYKLDVVITLALMTPFMMDLGFSKTDIGTISKGFGLAASLIGTFVGGIWMTRLGIHRSLWIFGILQALSTVTFFLLARMGKNYPMLVITIGAENFFSGMGNAAYSAFLMSLCNPRFTATQFALLTSLMAVTRSVAGAPTGWLAKTVGWEFYYIAAMLLSIPGFLLLLRYPSWSKLKTDQPSAS